MKKLSLILLVLLLIQPKAKSNSFLHLRSEIDSIQPFEKQATKSHSIKKTTKDAFFKTSPVVQNAISGRLAGVRIIPHSNDPGAAFSIISRGRSRLYGTDHPLVYINGVPMYFQPQEYGNFLNIINPQDVEKIQFLKNGGDIVPYGYNAGNGVLLITTKTAITKKPFSVSFNNWASISQNTNTVDVLNASQYRRTVLKYLPDDSDYLNKLGQYNTNWQDEVLQNAFGYHQHLSINGLLGKTSYRVTGGHNKQEGVLKNSDYSRWTGNINLNRMLFNDHLSLNLGYNTSRTDHEFANEDAFAQAIIFDPTQASSSKNNIQSTEYNTGFNYHPLWILDNSGNGVDQRNWNLNFKADYKLPFLKGAKASLLIGKNKSKDKRSQFENKIFGTTNSHAMFMEEGSYKMNTTIVKFEVDYQTRISNTISLLDAKIGFIKQKDKLGIENEEASLYFIPSDDLFSGNFPSGDIASTNDRVYKLTTYDIESKTKSIYTQLTVELWERLLVAVNFRLDAGKEWDENAKSSSINLNYQLLKNPGTSLLNTLHLKMGYALLGRSNDEIIRKQLDREHTTNFGVDMAFFNKRITTSFEAYILKHKNLLFPAEYTGIGGSSIRYIRGAKIENKGFEFTLNAIPVSTDNLNWNLQFNLAYNKNKLVHFDPKGQIKFHYTHPNLANSIDNELYSFFVFPQIYNTNGKPIETQHADRDELREYKSGAPKVILGLSSQLKYKKWDAAFTLRANLDNYTYNQAAAVYGFNGNVPDNMHKSVLKSDFLRRQTTSDYYLHNSSFLKLENISIGYTIPKLWGKNIGARIYATGQNLFTITGYDGLNPDTPFGIDFHTLPQARTMALGVQLNF